MRFHIIVSFHEIGRNRNGEAGDQFLEKVRYSVLVLKMLVFKVIMRCSAGVQVLVFKVIMRCSAGVQVLVFKVIMRCSAGVQGDHEVIMRCSAGVQGDHEVIMRCSSGVQGDAITGVGTAHSQRRFIDQIQTTHQDKDELLNDNEALNGMIYIIPIQTAIDSY
ncbi:hypothetical protein EMCRGX_G021899 [Ephydatia muelleri]